MKGICNVLDYGAVGDGKTDCTAAFQKALNEAGKNPMGGQVFVPAGEYLTGTLKVPAHVHFVGVKGWSYRSITGSVIKLKQGEYPCLLDITNAFGCTLENLTLIGNKKQNAHGIMFLREDFFEHPEEDCLRIESCQIQHFGGSGIFLQFVCAFSIRFCHIQENGGDGLFLNSWDGFITDNWFSGNEGWGIRSFDYGVNNSAMTLTANRVEWNKKGGFYIRNAKAWQITGNFFDRSGGPAIYIAEGVKPEEAPDPRFVKIPCHEITITGNIINRSGTDFYNDMDDLNKCHVRMHECFNVTFMGNTMFFGTNDDGAGNRSPKYGMVIDRLKGCVIANNNMYRAYLEKDIVDLGGHGEQVVLENNPSAPVKAEDYIGNGQMLLKW